MTDIHDSREIERDADEAAPEPSDAPERDEADDRSPTERIEALERERDELRDRWLRAKAEVENVRRRAREDVDEARRYGAHALLTRLLDVLDNLQRALASPPEGIDEGFLEGLRLTEQQWLEVLAAHGVEPVGGEGEPFDPTAHRVVLEQPTDEQAPGTIVAEIARGYRLHDRLLREAQVIVARAPDGEPGTGGPTADED